MKNPFYTIVALTLFFFFKSSNSIYAQEIEWQKTIGGDTLDLLYSIAPAADGGYFCGGWSVSDSSGNKTEHGFGGEDYWVVKLDSTGAIQWQNTIGGNSRDRFYSISPTIDGGCICGGESFSNISGEKTENSMGADDCWVVKLDANGNIQWQNTIGGIGDEGLYSISQTSDGGYICGGSSNSNISGDKTENSQGFADFWIIKLDSAGNIQWQNTIGGSEDDGVSTISQTNDGGYICGGVSESPVSGDKTENCMGPYDFWIVKLDTAGNIQWQNDIGGNDMDYLNSVSETADSGYICGGESRSNISGDKTENCLGDWDCWILKLDATGNIQWQNTFGGSYGDLFGSISQTADGGYICGTSSNSNISTDKTENPIGIRDYWILKFDSIGNIISQNTIGGADDDILYSGSATADGNYIGCGYSMSGISGDKREGCFGDYDYWVVKFTDKYNAITGKLFVDLNSNNVQDAGEQPVINKKIIEPASGKFTFSFSDGSYNEIILDTGTFSISPDPINYYIAVPVSHSATFSSGYQQIDSLNDFAYQPTGVFNDLCLTITPVWRLRPGSNAGYMIDYVNYGTTSLSSNIKFFPDSNLTYVSSNFVPISVTTDSVLWNTGMLDPYETGSILVTVHIDSGLAIGTPINPVALIEPIAGDTDPACNIDTSVGSISNAFDPNDILVSENQLTTIQLSSQPYLDYLIRFQNTGNDTALTIKVLNPIDTTKLDLSSFEFVSSSHPVNIKFLHWERNMEFKFESIMLPDSNANESLSHGFVRYRIKPKTSLSAGDTINNFALIYFDFNVAVITNIAWTAIVLPAGENQLSYLFDQLHIYPNPVSEQLNIKNVLHKGNEISELKIFDLFGREIYRTTIRNSQPKIELNVSGLLNGIYFLQLGSDDKLLRAKFVKQ